MDINNGTPTSWNYYVTDHLGSTRMVVDSNDSIRETINYYPFGSEMQMTNPALLTGGTSHPYRFTGKELDRLTSLNMYDFGARWYDVAGVPMWTSIDPLCEKYYNVSPYAYCAGDPVMFVDPDGENPIYDTHGNFLGCTSEGYIGQIYVYKGSEILDWGKQTMKDLLEKDDVGDFMTFEAVESSYLGDAKAKLVSNVMTDIVKHAENKHIFEYSFSTSTLYEGGVGFNLRSDSHFSTEKRKGEDKVRIVAHENTGRDYEATVENLSASLLVHEWYSHGIKGYGDAKNNHRLAYSNVMRDKTFYPKTTIKYKNFVRNMYNKYKNREIKR